MRFTIPVTEINEHITLPITEQITRKLISDLAAGDIFGDRVAVLTDGRVVSTQNSTTQAATTTNTNIRVRASNVMNPKNAKTFMPAWGQSTVVQSSDVNMHTKSTVFHDKKAGTTLLASDAALPILMEVEMEFTSGVHANDVANRLYTLFGPQGFCKPQDLFYSYSMPELAFSLLFVGFKLRGLALEGNNYFDYLREHSKYHIEVLVNKNPERKNFEPVIARTAYDAMVQIDLSQDKPEKELIQRYENVYKISFSMYTQISRPTNMTLHMPIVINNQLTTNYTGVPAFTDYFKENTKQHLDTQLAPIGRMTEQTGYIKLPWYDDWVLPRGNGSVQSGHIPILTSIFLIDTEHDQTTHDLTDDLGGASLTDEGKAILEQYGSGALYFDCPMVVMVMANDMMVDPSILSIENSVLHVPNRDTSKVYRLVILQKEIANDIYRKHRQWYVRLLT